ncbi:DUF922 domain-containing protein [Aquimonas sp.]|jgi:predicted secreted Zn-dependent protease|uniref:DUF922 domain-containing protein n=1 Tax=Aquimonas sp. TaxID=1872588 RepID=UPI0037BE548D
MSASLRRLLFCLITMAPAVAGSAPPAPTATVRIDFTESTYPVQARNLREVKRALDVSLPYAAHGLTASSFELQQILQPEPGSCRLASHQLSLQLQLLMPRWDVPNSTTPADRQRWQHALDALAAHELRHRQHAEDAAQDLDARLRQLGSQTHSGDCDKLQRQIDRLRVRALQRLRLRDALFDEATRQQADIAERERATR